MKVLLDNKIKLQILKTTKLKILKFENDKYQEKSTKKPVQFS